MALNYEVLEKDILYSDQNGNNVVQVNEQGKEETITYDPATIKFKGKNNTVFLHGNNLFKKVNIQFSGNGNILVLPDLLSIEESTIQFVGNDSLCYLNLSGSKRLRLAHFVLGSECVFYYGKGTNINVSDYPTHFYIYESSNVIIGDKCLISNDVIIRTCDNHLFYDLVSKERINMPGSVFIGDKCWICQGVYINKNTVVGSGTIVGARSVIGKRVFPSNTLVAGQPGKVLRENIAILGKNNRCYVKEDIENSRILEDAESYVFVQDDTSTSIEMLDDMLKNARTASKKLDVVIKELVNNTSKNRFAINKKI